MVSKRIGFILRAYITGTSVSYLRGVGIYYCSGLNTTPRYANMAGFREKSELGVSATVWAC